jgi:hypothetical protein
MFQNVCRCFIRSVRLQSAWSNTRHQSTLKGKDVARMRQIKAMVDGKRAQEPSLRVVRGIVFGMCLPCAAIACHSVNAAYDFIRI